MINTDRYLKISIIVLEVFIILVGIYAVFAFSQNQKTEIKYKAIDACTKAAIDVKPGELIEYVYKLCLKDKGIK